MPDPSSPVTPEPPAEGGDDGVRATVAGYAARADAAPPAPDRGRRRVAIAAGVLAVLGVLVLAVVLLVQKERREDREAIEVRRAVVVERARLTRLQAPKDGSARELLPVADADAPTRLAARAALVAAAETAITRDARARARARELDGPIAGTECGPIARRPDAVPDDRVLTRQVGRYDCIAVKSDVRQGGRSVGRLGHPFVAALDFRDFTFVWCRNTPPQSERGEVLVSVRLDRRCLAATGRALGSGYIDEP